MNLASKDIRHNVGRFSLTTIGIGMLLMVVMGMGGIYYLIHRSHVDCFQMPSHLVENASVLDFVYFSFVTVTTVGYGDIVPRHSFARGLVLCQVLFGLYLILRCTRPEKVACGGKSCD